MEELSIIDIQQKLEQATSNEDKAQWHHELAKAYANTGNFKDAEEHVMHSMALDDAAGKPLCIKKNLILADCIRNQARFSEAVQYLSRTVNRPTIGADRTDIAKSHLMICLALLEQGDFQEALEHVSAAREIARELEHAELEAQSGVKLGIILMELKDEQGGIKAFEDALGAFREIGDIKGIAVTLMNIANGYITLQDYVRAKPFLEEAIRLNEERSNSRHLALNYHGLGLICQGLGSFDDALSYFKMALEGSQKHDDKRLLAYAHLSIGEVFKNELYKGYDEERALSHLTRALETVRSYGSIADEYKVHKVLAAYYEELEDWEQFAFHFKKYHILERDTISTAARNKAGKLEAVLQLERKEKELELARARTKEIEARHDRELANQKLETFTRFALKMAHEIQNPLQFVNNFAELNVDMAEELEEVLDGLELPEDVKDILADMVTNSAKINQHGRRISEVINKLLTKVNTDKSKRVA